MVMHSLRRVLVPSGSGAALIQKTMLKATAAAAAVTPSSTRRMTAATIISKNRSSESSHRREPNECAKQSTTAISSSHLQLHARHQHQRRSTFSFAGPKKLEEIMKIEYIRDKSGVEITDIWYKYHEMKDGVTAICLNGRDGHTVLQRAEKSPFFVQPVFRDDGFFMLISQYIDPNHFLMAYLEDYKMDPNSASPLITFSVFNEFADSKDLSLVRVDILNPNIENHEGYKVVQSVLDNYRKEDDYTTIRTFNERPKHFDIDDYISRMNDRWKQEPPSVSSTPSSSGPSP